MKILISGGGIAGLTLAYWLQRYGFQPTVVERMPDVSRAKGYLIDFWGPGCGVARQMGLIDRMQQHNCHIHDWKLVDRRGAEILSMDLEKLGSLLGGPVFNFFRGDLEAMLLDKIRDDVELRMGTSIERMRPTDDFVETQMTDGTTERWDLVIGADGVHSNVRRLAFGEEEQFIRHLGYTVAAVTLPSDDHDLQQACYLYNEPGRLLMLFRCPSGLLIGYLIGRTPQAKRLDSSQRAAWVRGTFREMQWLVPELLESVDDRAPIFMDTVSQICMPSWSRGRVSLVGDAAGCLTLLAGQGASMAMAGAHLLAQQLGEAQGDFPVAFARYEAALKPGIMRRQREARRLAKLFFVPRSAAGVQLRNWTLKAVSLPLAFGKLLSPALLNATPLANKAAPEVK